jgi:hypothetical protein
MIQPSAALFAATPEASMSYLYGDSTPSTLETNYIEFLRDAVDFCVQVLLADQRMEDARVRTSALDRSSAAEIDRLQQLAATVERTMAAVPSGAPDSATTRCAAAIVRAADGIVRAEVSAVQAALESEQERRDGQAARERDGCVKELERLLVKHDLPDMTMHTQLALASIGGRYHCRGRLTTEFGLGAILDLDVPAGHLCAQLVRLDRLFERLEVQMPEMTGWLHKEVKLKPQHLEKHHLTALSIAAGQSVLKLRVAPDGSGAGIDVVVTGEDPRVRLVRIDEHGEPSGDPFEAQAADAAKLLALHDKLAAAAAELGRHRRAIVEATFDGESLRTSNKATILVERLIANMAPVVQEIAARSHSPGELVLRRQLADDRREEVFLSKSELRRKVEPLAEGMRALFDRLLVDGGPRKEPAPPADKSPATDKLAAPVRPSRVATPLVGVGASAAGAIPGLPIPATSTTQASPPPPADPPRVSLKARLSGSMPVLPLPRRETPTNPGPAIAPVVPPQLELPPSPEPRPRTGTPLSGVPVVEVAPSPTSPVAEVLEVKEIEPTPS